MKRTGAILVLVLCLMSVCFKVWAQPESGGKALILTPIYKEEPENGFGRDDIAVGIAAKCPESGIWNINYTLTADGVVTQHADIYQYYENDPRTPSVIREYVSERAILVDKDQNNSKNISVMVTVTDQNGFAYSEALALAIDSTSPEVRISYEDTAEAVEHDGMTYFAGGRTANIFIREQNFAPDRMKVEVEGGTAGEWEAASEENLHYMVITFEKEGPCSLKVTGKDLAGNDISPIVTTAAAPYSFVIDRTAPVISIRFDEAEEGLKGYFRGSRTALVTINEENPFESLFFQGDTPLETAKLVAGSETRQQYRITFAEDGVYELKVRCTDAAGNTKEEKAEPFVIDTKAPEIRLQGISEGIAYASEKPLKLEASASDDAMQSFSAALVGEFFRDGRFFEENLLEVRPDLCTLDGNQLQVSELPEDGVYRLTLTAADKAGNQTVEACMFTVNRKGMVFEPSDASRRLLGQFYVQQVSEPVEIFVYDPDPIGELEVRLNNQVLEQHEDYEQTAKEQGKNGHWNRHLVSFPQSLFEEEGEYRLLLLAEDEAGHVSDNELSGRSILFTVDRTAPLISAVGLKSGGRYYAENHEAVVSASDFGGKVSFLQVDLVDEKETVLKELLKVSGEEAEGEHRILLPEGLHQNVRVICKDSAFDEEGEGNVTKEIFADISVSQKGLRLFFTGRGWMVFAAGMLVIGAAAGGAWYWRRRRK